jgi:group II intron reverse transcriptase/maturase
MEPLEGNMAGASEPDTVFTRQQRIAELAKRAPQMGFTSLNHHLDLQWLQEAYRRTRKDGAPGVDGQTAEEYEKDLEGNLRSLLERAKSGTYRAPPVRRVHIPKGTGGETRPIGVPTLEDKILQRAVVMILEAIYEQDFHDCSYGFRPKCSAHQALAELWRRVMQMGGGWILEVDIRKFFDTLDHARLRELLRLRVRDGVLLRLIGKWLKAGVMEDGAITRPAAGSPQGGVISPLLSNIYLHYVLDEWFERQVKPVLRGRAFIIRYADDFVIGFSDEGDAKRVEAVLPNRFAKYGLTIHSEKTRLVPFQRPPSRQGRQPSGPVQPGTFDLLGFTHYWGRSRRNNRGVKVRTAASRQRRALSTLAAWCRGWRHEPIPQQHYTLSQKMRGHYAYYGVTGNYRSLNRFYYAVRRIWRTWLSRRSWKSPLTWSRFERLLERFPLPPPRVVHSVYRLRAKP